MKFPAIKTFEIRSNIQTSNNQLSISYCRQNGAAGVTWWYLVLGLASNRTEGVFELLVDERRGMVHEARQRQDDQKQPPRMFLFARNTNRFVCECAADGKKCQVPLSAGNSAVGIRGEF